MGRDPQLKPVPILYIGRVDSAHEKLWEQMQREGVAIKFARTQKAGLELAAQVQPQVVVINLADAQFSGTRLAQTLGRRLPSARRLLLVDRGTALQAPAEQRLVRPFTTRKLRETIAKLIEEASPHVIQIGCLQLDVIGRVVTGPNGQQHLTPKQCDLLVIFMQHPNQVISRKELMDRIWDTAYLGDTRTLDVHIRWLREKIEPVPTEPALLLTKRGVGYVLVISDRQSPVADTAEGE